MDIYDYITQMKLFLASQERDDSDPVNLVSAGLVIRFQRATVLNILQSKQFLAQFPSVQQLQYVEIAEQWRGKEIYDPIEDDPSLRPLFELVFEEAKQETEIWHQQRIAELEQRSSLVAELLLSRRGLIHRYWARVKQLLWERYQIEWRSPAEMNPWIFFD